MPLGTDNILLIPVLLQIIGLRHFSDENFYFRISGTSSGFATPHES
jgi:hypothetical protein